MALEDLHTNALTATRRLSKIEDQIDQFRLAETYRSIADVPDEIARAETLTGASSAEIDRASAGFRALSPDAEVLNQFNWFQSEWTAYALAHDHWAKGQTGAHPFDPHDTLLPTQFERTKAAIAAVISANRTAAELKAGAARQAAAMTISLLIAASIGGVLLVAFLLVAVGRQISTPLASVIRSLRSLAAGNLHVSVVDTKHGDEIGTLASAVAGYRDSIRKSGEVAEQAMAEHKRLEAAMANMPHGLCMFDAEVRLVICNARYAEMYNLPPEKVRPGISLKEIVDCRHEIGNGPLNFPDYVNLYKADVTPVGTEVAQVQLENGRTIRVSRLSLKGGGYVATHEDVTEAVRAEAHIKHLENYDALTHLPNRIQFRRNLQRHLMSRASAEQVAVLCLDLDHFKALNDTLGHPVGDALLMAVTLRLRECVGTDETIARLSGDEFAMMQVGLEQPASATSLAKTILEVLRRPYEVEGHQAIVGASIGIALGPGDGDDPDELLKNADLALYQAKSDGRGVFRFFEPAMAAKMLQRRRLETDLRAALAKGEFRLHYQPFVDIESGLVTGFEALLRWQHPDRGLIGPDEFIGLAEETELIVPIGAWVIQRACLDAASWPRPLRVAVNLSAVQFRDPDIATTVFGALAASQLPAGRLELEIT